MNKTVSLLQSQEFKDRWEAAVSNYRRDPSCENAAELRAVAALYNKQRSGLPSIGPLLAIFDAVKLKHDHDRDWLLKLWAWSMKKFVLTPDRPGWNDYYMVYWQLTGDSDAAAEIHRRAEHWPIPESDPGLAATVKQSAQWMVRSMRQQDPAFNEAMNWMANRCPNCNPTGVVD